MPDSEPFISVNVEKITADESGNIVQVVGDFDRLYKRLSDIAVSPIGTVADDGYIDPLEIYVIIAKTAYAWIIEEHGGEMIGNKLVVG